MACYELIVTGNAADALDAASRRGVGVWGARPEASGNQTRIRTTDSYFAELCRWVAETPRTAPHDPGGLLFFYPLILCATCGADLVKCQGFGISDLSWVHQPCGRPSPIAGVRIGGTH